MSGVVLTRDQGHVRTITLNRPDKMNALSHALAWAIVTEVQKAAHDDDVWVIAITGNGRAFCAGLDLTGPGDDVSPLPPQERLMDDISWVGRFALVLRHGATNRSSPASAASPPAQAVAGDGGHMRIAARSAVRRRLSRIRGGPHVNAAAGVG
jgi:hypothetical protein